MSQPFIVSIHIPKTAGTTLGDVFSRCLNRRVFYDYGGYENPTAHPDITQHREFITSHFDVLHGHFVAEKYLNVFPEAKFVATLRHPVERTISQYNHEITEISSSAWYHADVVSGRMDVVTFAAQDGVRNALSQHLKGRALKDYDILMISENLDLSMQIFMRDVRFLDLDYAYGAPAALPKLNETKQRKMLETFSSDIRIAIFEKTKEDNEVYREAQELLLAKSRTL